MKSFADFGINVEGRTGSFKTTCPECSASRRNSRDACLSVDIEQGLWNCFHCSFAGSLGLNYDEKVKRLVKPEYQDSDGLSAKARKWFASRGITPAVLAKNKITDGPEYMPQLGETVNAIRFPYYKDGAVVNVKCRDGQKNFKMVKDGEKTLYKYDDISEEALIIVEGEMDALSFQVAGFDNCVSVPNGASGNLEFFDELKERLAIPSSFVLAVDSDEAGQKLQKTLLGRLPPDLCKILIWPDGVKDANQTLMERGPDCLRELVKNAKWTAIEGVTEVSDVVEKVVDMYDHGVPLGLSPGWYALERLYTVRKGEWTLIGGIPSHGKSGVLDNIMVNLAESDNWKFGIFSPENRPIERHIAKLMAIKSGKPFRDGFSDRLPPQDLIPGLRWMHEHFTFITPPENKMTVPDILHYAEQLVLRKELDGFVCDPWGAMNHTRSTGLTEHEYIGQMLGKIVRFVSRFNIHIWVVAHPTKMRKEKGALKQPLPTPYDASGSSHWFNSGDNCLTVWRDIELEGENPEIEIHCQKIRFPEIGRRGVAKLDFEYKTGKYYDQ